MNRLIFILVAIALYILATMAYRKFNRGLSRSAKHQQSTRMAVASALSMLPWIVAGQFNPSWATAIAALVALLTGMAYPCIFHAANRRTSPDYDNYMDITFGLYFWGLASGLTLLAPALPGGVTLSVILWGLETLLVAAAALQIGYYILYRNSIDASSVEVLLSTGLNEVLEFLRYYNFLVLPGAVLAVIAIIFGMLAGNLATGTPPDLTAAQIIILAVYVVAMAILMFKGRRSPWRRLGLVSLVNEVRALRKGASKYKAESAARAAAMKVKELAPPAEQPSCVILVIGESANRDYMSTFTTMDRTTTPWLESLAGDEGMTIFKNAYSCAIQTVPAVRMMVTEANQYGGTEFSRACSIIDVAHALGRRVYWYSNQGHLGTFDTPVSMIAESADVAKWTHQEVGKPQFDETLVDFLSEVDPATPSLVVLHLKGSHFNYLNRFPKADTVWTTPDMRDDSVNYMNAIRYTDKVLSMIHDYATAHLNLEAMVYVSDHGENPLKRRSPRFDGFENTRIPLMVWLSADYRRRHPQRWSALRGNMGKYFTNDLTYELLCAIFDIESPNFDTTSSIAHSEYRHTRETLLTYEGRIKIADDNASASVKNL